MKILKKIGEWLVMGVFIGVGFTAASFVVSYYAMDLYAESMEERMNEKIGSGVRDGDDGESGGTATRIGSFTEAAKYREFDEDAGLIITSHRGRRAGSDFRVIGTLENQGTGAWRFIGLEVELFDGEGTFVEECSTFLDVTLDPGESENFVVSCGSCGAGPLPAFEDYRIAVTRASFESPRGMVGADGEQ